MAGPTDAPIIRMSVLIPSDTPVSCLGVVNIMTFIAPTFVSESPVDKIARFVETRNSVEWYKKRLTNPIVLIILPNMIGFVEPSFETIKPDVGPKISNTMANGSWTLLVIKGSSPNPSGEGLRTSTGIV